MHSAIKPSFVKMPIRVTAESVKFFGLQTPFRCGLFGSSRSGKSTTIFKFLKSDLIDHNFSTIYYVGQNIGIDPAMEWHKDIDSEFVYLNELPTKDFFRTAEPDSLIIFDDLWLELCQSTDIKNCFKVYAGKQRMSIFVTSQNPFEGSAGARVIRNQLSHVMLFQNAGDVNINLRIAQQLGCANEFRDARKVYNRPYQFVLINVDMRRESPLIKIITNILETPICYT